MGFLADLAEGTKAEAKVLDILVSKGLRCGGSSKEDRKLYDIWFMHGDKRYTAEVKYDKYEAKSGNLAIEFYNPKTASPSGIGITQADFWIHILTMPEKIYITQVSKLKEFVATVKPLRIIAAGGDDNASMYLYKKEIILPIFAELNLEFFNGL